jgi:two-component system, OmpR family, sensor kinase
MFRSIRWSLQLWHAGILAVALASFGTALYMIVRNTQMERVNAELEGAARALANAAAAPGALDFGWGGRPPRDRGDRGGGRRGDFNPDAGGRGGNGATDMGGGRGGGGGGPGGGQQGLGGPNFGGGGPGFGGGGPGFGGGPGGPGGPGGRGGRGGGPGGPGGPWEQPDWWATVPEDVLRRIGENEQDQPYFVIWGADGTVLRSSENAHGLPLPQDAGLLMSTWVAGVAAKQPDPVFRDRAVLREVIVPGPYFGVRVLVGKSLASERNYLLMLRWELYGAGAAVMAIGLCGGWFLSARATRPIQSITETARAITATDLSRRIATEETESELGALALTLNETFERLQTAFERQVRFTADASHELRTPLSVIHSQAELSLSRERSAVEYKQSLETCLRAAKRMKSLVESLLVLARADAGKLVLNQETFDLAAAAEECVALVTPRAQERQVQLEIRKPADAGGTAGLSIYADRTRIMQLMTNLLANAIQYNREGGKVTLTLAPTETEMVLAVADTGVGISAEDQAKVFERFFRADKSRSRDMGGSGLGLAICRSIMEAHHGAITFTSRPGEGTTFTVRLRRGETAAPAAGGAATAAKAETAARVPQDEDAGGGERG